MAKLIIAKFAKAYEEAGKTIVKSNLEFVSSHGTIGVTDPAFGGRRKGEFGEFITLRTADGGMLFISLDKGCPAGANKFEIKEYVATADYEKMKEGDVIFKAFAVVAEDEE